MADKKGKGKESGKGGNKDGTSGEEGGVSVADSMPTESSLGSLPHPRKRVELSTLDSDDEVTDLPLDGSEETPEALGARLFELKKKKRLNKVQVDFFQ